jgi:ATP-dependent DNA ligase
MPETSGPLLPPIEPMLAKPMENRDLASLGNVVFEPKWDGFRCLLFRTDDGVVLQGRGRSRTSDEAYVDLAYAFPEVVAAAESQVPVGVVLDGEIVVIRDRRLDFALLSSRLRPRSEAAGPSIARLCAQAPAVFLAFDVLACPEPIMSMPLSVRRARLESLAASWSPPLLLTPSTTDPVLAGAWFSEFESAGVDGLIVKPSDEPYAPGKRSQGKIKHQRTADVVVAGWRAQPAKDGREVVASLLLGLHDGAGRLHFVGGASAFTAQVRWELVELIAPYLADDDLTHPWAAGGDVRIPGGSSRWSKGKDWRPLLPSLVAEVSYDQMEAERFRHTAGFVRWRPDREASSCTFEQVPSLEASSIEDLLQP